MIRAEFRRRLIMQEVFRGAAGFSDPEKVNADVVGIYMCTYQMDCNET